MGFNDIARKIFNNVPSFLRTHLIFIISYRQYYSFVTDPGCKRLGSQCWVLGAVMFTESLLCIKNGKTLFERTQALNIILWVLVMLLFSVLCVYGFVAWQWYFQVSELAFQNNNFFIGEFDDRFFSIAA